MDGTEVMVSQTNNMQALGGGGLANLLMANNFNPLCLRPYIGNDGQHYISTNQGGEVKPQLTYNATATLRKDEWIQLDTAVTQAAQSRLKAFADLRATSSYVIPNGLGKTTLEHQNQSDINAATLSMDGLSQGNADRPHYDLSSLPLPIVHKDFHVSARQLAASRNGGSPFDTSMAALASIKVAEEIEKLYLGVAATYTFGGGTVYGLTNFPSRLTKTMTAPTTTNQSVTVGEVLAMKNQSQVAKHYGPWVIYCSPAWDEYLDADYSSSKGDNTLRDRIKKIEGITDVKTLDFLTGTTMILVQKTPNVARAVIGMDIVTLQWESQGGMQLNYKVMGILVPQLRADYNGNTGIVHGSV